MNRSKRIGRPLTLVLSIGLFCAVVDCSDTFAAGDDFNDNAKDPAKWGTDNVAGNGVQTETNQRLEYTCAIGTLEDDSNRPWILTRMPYNANWDAQVDVFNSTAPSTAVQVSSSGILVTSPFTSSSNIIAELYASSLGGPPQRNGFYSELMLAGNSAGTADSTDLGVSHGAVRISFDAITKVLTVAYDTDPTDGYQWMQFGSFGIAGFGGTTANANWALGATDQMFIYVYGFSSFMTVTGGQMYNDNFTENGGVTPTGPPPPPAPTGSFHFGFPVNNPLLTAIVFLSGNYHGVTPTSSQRNYSLDVAQDDTGHLMAMGTMDGIANANGSPNIGASVGAVTTVNGEPTAQLNGSFNGTRDGVNTSFTGMAQGPVEVVDIGGGTDGVNATASYSSSIGGVPFMESNLPVQLAAPPGAVDNLHKDWSLQLDITAKGKKKPKLSVGAQLVLPNGDTIVFKAKKANFSSTTGVSSLTFTKGRNIITNQKDKLTTITLNGLTFAFQNGAWQPTGGTITYHFLGQQGTANLLDFIFTP